MFFAHNETASVTHQKDIVWEIEKRSITRGIQNDRESMMGGINVAKLNLIL